MVSDIFDTLAAHRPYRESLPVTRVLEIIRKEAPHATCVEALEQSGVTCDQSFVDLHTLQETIDQKGIQPVRVPFTQDEDSAERAMQDSRVF